MKFAIVVHACDRYSFLYKGFDFFFKKYWDNSITCNKYFTTELIDAQLQGFNNIKSGPGEWSDRLRRLLTEIEEEYIIYMQEDMWLAQPVNGSLFNSIMDFTDKNGILQFKLHSSEIYVTIPTDEVIQGLRIGKLDHVKSGFLMSHQITIWNRKFLLSQLPNGEHPWRNERKGTKRLRKIKYDIFHIDLFAENNKTSINKNIDEHARSKYFTVSVNGTFSDNVRPLLDEMLLCDNEGIVNYATEIVFRLDHQITHDGMPKPRRQDIVKRFKTFLKKKLFDR